MKEMDSDGLSLCKLQGNVFESSLDSTKSSSEIFMRRFMMSEVAKEFDSSAILNDSMTVNDVFDSIENEFGRTSYGKVRYGKEVLFWIGYLYRYMSYSYGLSSKYVYKIIKPKELNSLYYAYHTFDCSQAIERILEEKCISFDTRKENERLLRLLRQHRYEKEIIVTNQKLTYSERVNKEFERVPVLRENMHISEYTVSPQAEKKKITISILFKEYIVGRTDFVQMNSTEWKIIFQLNDTPYRDKDIDAVALKKSLQYAKNIPEIHSLRVELLKKDEHTIMLYKKLGFGYQCEDENFASYLKILK